MQRKLNVSVDLCSSLALLVAMLGSKKRPSIEGQGWLFLLGYIVLCQYRTFFNNPQDL